MENSWEDPSKFVDEVEKFSGSKLNRKIELLRIYEEAVTSKNEKAFEDLVFTAKYVEGLLRVVKSGAMNPEIDNIDNVKKDFSDNLNKAADQIRKIISASDDSLKSYFENTYFELSQQGFINFNELLSDLEWTKKYMNVQKRK